MTITASQKESISSVINAILTAVAPPPSKKGQVGEIGGHGQGSGRGRRRVLSGMFLMLLDRNDWAEYYELIPNPRALHPIRDTLAEDKYTDPLEVYTDLSLVFWNALFYNERESQIAKDAVVLKSLLEVEWAKHTDLPQPRSHSPPPGSAQKAYPDVELEEKRKEEEKEKEKEREKEAEINAKNNQAVPDPVEPEPQVDIMDIDMEESASEVSETEGEIAKQIDANSDADIESQVEDTSLDVDNDAIVRHLDSSIPRWPGFDDSDPTGWLADGNTELYLALLHAIKGHKDVIGNRLATALESIQDVIEGPTSTTKGKPVTFKVIEARIKSHSYPTAASFDMDMMLLFEKGRRWWEPAPTNAFTPPGKPSGGTRDEYAKVLILQSLYQALTSPYSADRPSSGPPYSSETNFASLQVGPGRIHTTNDNPSNPTIVFGSKQISTITQNRIFLDQIKYKGWTIRVGDWVHLANGCDALNGGSSGRPIVAQVWKVWKKETNDHVAGFRQEAEGQYGITVCWYYRPQDTFHASYRVFWENEVFKSSHFASHPLTDIIEPIFVQPTREYIRGRPRTAEGERRLWYPGWPLYVCDSRYSYSKGHRAHRNYVRSLNGQPASLLKANQSPSPVFVKIGKWESCMPPEIQSSKSSKHPKFGVGHSIFPFERVVFPRRRLSPFVDGTITGTGGGPGGLVQDNVSNKGPTKGVLSVGGSTSTAQQQLQYLQQLANAANTQNPAGSSGSSSQPLSQYWQYYQNASALPAKPSKPERTTTANTLATAQGSAGSQLELSRLPNETTRHFSRDPTTGSLLWFPTPPVNVPGRKLRVGSGTSGSTTRAGAGVGYSLEYLHWRAMQMQKKLAGELGESGGVAEAQEDGEDEDERRLGKRKAPAQVDGGDSEQPELNGAGGVEAESPGHSSSLRKKQRQDQERTTMIETLAPILKSL